jgi:hypothetical protein
MQKEVLSVDDRIIPKRMERCGRDSSGSGYRLKMDSYGYGIEPSTEIKCWQFLSRSANVNFSTSIGLHEVIYSLEMYLSVILCIRQCSVFVFVYTIGPIRPKYVEKGKSMV